MHRVKNAGARFSTRGRQPAADHPSTWVLKMITRRGMSPNLDLVTLIGSKILHQRPHSGQICHRPKYPLSLLSSCSLSLSRSPHWATLRLPRRAAPFFCSFWEMIFAHFRGRQWPCCVSRLGADREREAPTPPSRPVLMKYPNGSRSLASIADGGRHSKRYSLSIVVSCERANILIHQWI
jgi:hypothetical protein